jgi:hypothetical protein
MRSISETETFLSLLRTHLSGRISRSDAERYNLEGTFFKEQIIPNIHSFLCAQGLRSDRAKESLLAEGYRIRFSRSSCLEHPRASHDTRSRKASFGH